MGGIGIGLEGNRERLGVKGLKLRCLPGAFASALHVLCTLTLACFPSASCVGCFVIFLCSDQLSCRGREGGRVGGDCLGRLGLEEPGSQLWVSGQGLLLCSQPCLCRIAPAPLTVSLSSAPPYSVSQGPYGTGPEGCDIQLPSYPRWGTEAQLLIPNPTIKEPASSTRGCLQVRCKGVPLRG